MDRVKTIVLLQLAYLYFAEVAPYGAWSDIEMILSGLRNHERKRFTFTRIHASRPKPPERKHPALRPHAQLGRLPSAEHFPRPVLSKPSSYATIDRHGERDGHPAYRAAGIHCRSWRHGSVAVRRARPTAEDACYWLAAPRFTRLRKRRSLSTGSSRIWLRRREQRSISNIVGRIITMTSSPP